MSRTSSLNIFRNQEISSVLKIELNSEEGTTYGGAKDNDDGTVNGEKDDADDEESDTFYSDLLFLLTVGSFIAAGGMIFVLHTIDKRKEQ